MSPCNNRASYQGCCCCNCAHQVEVHKHPWNEGAAKGSISTVMGHGCGVRAHEGSPAVIYFFDRKHGMCELHQARA